MDYQPLKIDFVFTASSIEQQLVMIPITILDDEFVEYDETLEVVLSLPATTNGVTIGQNAIPVTIIDDDSKTYDSVIQSNS